MSATSPARVLVVDPYPDSAASLALLLQLCGYEVHCLPDGSSVLAACRVLRPAAVILELRLPGLDGWELAEQIRRHDDLQDILLIAMTTYGREEDQMHSKEAGIDHHLVKPADPSKLLQLLASRPMPPDGPDPDQPITVCARLAKK